MEATLNPAAPARLRWHAPEVVQTSAMDCGPAALACVLGGHGIRASYGRLREACQTDVDGTSIDTLEVVAGQLGLQAEQVMVPLDHLLRFGGDALPAIVVLRQGDGGTHFVVVWRRVGSWLQIMDPANGRRWTRIERLEEDLFRHRLSVPAADWRAWAETDEFQNPLRARLTALGADADSRTRLLEAAHAYRGWFGLGALDAATRLVLGLVNAGGLARGAAATRLLDGLVQDTLASPDDIYTLIPPDLWSVAPDPDPPERGVQHLLLHGAVALRCTARAVANPGAASDADEAVPLSRELQASLDEPAARPLAALWQLLRADGLLAPLVLAGAALLATGALVVEALLFKGLIDAAAPLQPGLQRLGAAAAVIAFLLLLFAVELPIVRETLRLGRHLDARLRLALLAKLPRLGDRYFQSRPVSDMADRGHAIVATRQVPTLGLQVVQTLGDLAFTLVGIALLDAASVPWAAGIAACAVGLPLALQPLLNERDLRVRTQAASLAGCHLDALLGLVPIRTHRAAVAMRRQHEGLLVAWARSSRSLIRWSIAASGAQAAVGMALTCGLLLLHFQRVSGVSGGDLLLVYWALKLPRSGQRLAELAQRYPAQRNVLLRLAEPLAAPEDPRPAIAAPAPDAPPADTPPAGVSIRLDAARVLAAGHTVLDGIDLAIAPGEQVAIVGLSGAGKSSLLGLLLGWHRLSEGELQVDGQTLDEARLPALRRETAWVDPAVQLWNQSLIDNLLYASEGEPLDRLSGALQSARLRGLLQQLPDGLQTPLGEGGARVSGGEGQRVRLARALMQDGVRLVLLDEPFRGLDRSQRSALLAEARTWWQGATMLCVTHDVSETLGFDRVLVIEDGCIAEDDAPATLAARPSRYRELLDAEVRVRDGLWLDPQWRRLQLVGGRLEASA